MWARTSSPRRAEQVFDATGCYVAPGFIESHTHVDGMMWWQPDLEPLPGNGVTTVVMGNCGFALAPVSEDPAVRAEVIKIFSFFEDFPEAPFFQNLPWDWTKWSEYKESIASQVRVPTNYAAFAGHIALRLAVMGLDAWRRAATPQEIQRIAELFDDALGAGALGLSTNLMDYDGQDRPVPSLLTTGLPVRVQWVGVPTLQWQKDFGLQRPLVELHERFTAERRDFWTGFMHVPITTVASIEHSLLFARSKISPFPQPRGIALDNPANDVGPVGVTLGEYADRLGVHCSDALAEWFIRNGVSSTVTMPPWPKDEAMVVRLLKDPLSVGNSSDAGAHGQMFCGLQDRGELAVGKRADVTVFDLDEVEVRPQQKTYDVPDGEGGYTWRWARDPAPVRLTLVNGVPTFEDGKYTSARPGVMLAPSARA